MSGNPGEDIDVDTGEETDNPEPTVTPERQALLDAIAAAAERFQGADFEGLEGTGVTSSLNPAIQQLLGFGTGQTTDPRFAQARQAQLQALSQVQQQQRAGQSEYLSRRGIGQSSAAALNQTNQLERQLATDKYSTTSNLALQEYNAQQQALGLGANLAQTEQGLQLGGIQSRNMAQQANLMSLAAGVETLALPEQLRIAELAAKNAGTTVSSGGGGGLFK